MAHSPGQAAASNDIMSCLCESLSTNSANLLQLKGIAHYVYLYFEPSIYRYIEIGFLAVSFLNGGFGFFGGWVSAPNLHTPPAAQQVFQPPWSIPQQRNQPSPQSPTITKAEKFCGVWRSSIPFPLKIREKHLQIAINIKMEPTKIHHVIHLAFQLCYLKNPTTYLIDSTP